MGAGLQRGRKQPWSSFTTLRPSRVRALTQPSGTQGRKAEVGRARMQEWLKGASSSAGGKGLAAGRAAVSTEAAHAAQCTRRARWGPQLGAGAAQTQSTHLPTGRGEAPGGRFVVSMSRGPRSDTRATDTQQLLSAGRPGLLCICQGTPGAPGSVGVALVRLRPRACLLSIPWALEPHLALRG